ncbi:hypothetical protein RP20_CCG025742 [Aedes albopictus]|nr:hypothetical protein RP20_CCG025742 [Aedes albopictus]
MRLTGVLIARRPASHSIPNGPDPIRNKRKTTCVAYRALSRTDTTTTQQNSKLHSSSSATRGGSGERASVKSISTCFQAEISQRRSDARGCRAALLI